MSLSDKWINNIFKIATGSKITRNSATPIGFIIFICFVSGLIFLSLYLDKLLGFNGFLKYPYDFIIGSIFLLPGIILTGLCVFYFLKSKGTPVPFNPPPKLICDGPYAYVRNPMLTGLFLQFFGFGIICNSILLSFIITPLFILANVFELKKIEEPELIKRLGDEYINYRNNTPMFIPKMKK